MKNKKGFTLIELIVTIALMLSILAMAIISFINVSNKKKQEAYEKIKKQIIVAAEEYFENNSYYKESLTAKNHIKVSLGALVDEDYLNVVTNPVTGKKLNKCNYVKVTKDQKTGLNYTFYDNKLDCSANSYIEVTEVSAPKLSINVSGREAKKNSGWDYKYNTDENPGPIITVTAFDKRSGISGDIQLKTDDGYVALNTELSHDKKGEVYTVDKASYSKTTNKSGKEVCYKAINNAGISSTKCINLKVDIDKPNCSVYVIGIPNGVTTVENKTIYNYKQLGTIDLLAPRPIVKLSYFDNGSGIDKVKIKEPGLTYKDYKPLEPYTQSNTNGKYVEWVGKLDDKAGNANTCSKYISVSEEKTLVEEIIENTNIKYCGQTEGESTTWTNNDRKITQEFKSLSITGLKSSTKNETYTSTTKTANIKDGMAICPVNVYVDKEQPYFDKIVFDTKDYVYLTQWDSKGNVVINKKPVKVVKNTNGKYTGTACVKNLVGKFNITGYTIYAKDDDSGINNNSWEQTRTYYSLNKKTWIGAQCLRTQKDNPCMMYDHFYVSDNAGNRSADMGMLEIRVGYIGVDEGCK